MVTENEAVHRIPPTEYNKKVLATSMCRHSYILLKVSPNLKCCLLWRMKDSNDEARNFLSSLRFAR